MRYNVKTLADISKISVRTLHHYDQIGLLSPSIRMRGHRYYGHKELLLLHEILFFKEMGLSLKKIKVVLDSSSSSRLYVLSTQKQKLQKEIERLQKVCESIDKTIAHYKGKKMSALEIHQQFQHFENKMKGMEAVFEKEFGEKFLNNRDKIAKEMSKEELESYAEKSMKFAAKIVAAINENLPINSVEVQELMQEHFDLSTKFCPTTKSEYLASRNYLKEDSPFREYYAILHPKLPEFLYEAMGSFAAKAFPDGDV
jgi:DNA-binding transcriptional MerR regulator